MLSHETVRAWCETFGPDYAARRFLRKLLKAQEYTLRVLITDKLRSYGAVKREVMASVEHRQSKYLNNRAENSHQRTRQRETHIRWRIRHDYYLNPYTTRSVGP